MHHRTPGVTTHEATIALMRLAGASDAAIAVHQAKLAGDWEAYEDACDRMTHEELWRECRGGARR